MPNMDPKSAPCPARSRTSATKTSRKLPWAIWPRFGRAGGPALLCSVRTTTSCSGLPGGHDIPGFIAHVASKGEFEGFCCVACPARCSRSAAASARRKTSARGKCIRRHQGRAGGIGRL